MLDTPSLMLTPEGEAQAVAAAQRAPGAFGPLYRAYVGPVYRYLFSRLGNMQDAEDLTSQVFIEALAGLPRYRHDGHFAAWLFTIARRRALNTAARRRADAPLEWAENLPGDAPDPLGSLVQIEELRRLRRQIAALSDDEQELLRLRFTAGLSFAELGALLGKSPEAIKKQVYRLLERLASRLEAVDE